MSSQQSNNDDDTLGILDWAGDDVVEENTVSDPNVKSTKYNFLLELLELESFVHMTACYLNVLNARPSNSAVYKTFASPHDSMEPRMLLPIREKYVSLLTLHKIFQRNYGLKYNVVEHKVNTADVEICFNIIDDIITKNNAAVKNVPRISKNKRKKTTDTLNLSARILDGSQLHIKNALITVYLSMAKIYTVILLQILKEYSPDRRVTYIIPYDDLLAELTTFKESIVLHKSIIPLNC